MGLKSTALVLEMGMKLRLVASVFFAVHILVSMIICMCIVL